MKLPLLLSLLLSTNGFIQIPTRTAFNVRETQKPFRLQAVQDDTAEEARKLFSAYCNDDGLMNMKVLRDVPYVKDLLVSVCVPSWPCVGSLQ